MQTVLAFFQDLFALIRILLQQWQQNRKAADRDAVRADPAAEWVRHMGGTDARDADSRPADSGGHRD